MTDKATLRARMRAGRLAFPPVAIPIWSGFLERLRPELVVASYRPLPGEADPGPLAEAARARGCSVAWPRVTRRGEPMRFHLTPAHLPFEHGPFGIEQPPASAETVEPDLVLTPLLAFDRRGARLGQGAGYYDRAFAALPDAWRVGVAWSIQEPPCVPTDPWDVPLNAIATEKEWITP